MKPEPKKKLPNKKIISSAKFEAKEYMTFVCIKHFLISALLKEETIT